MVVEAQPLERQTRSRPLTVKLAKIKPRLRGIPDVIALLFCIPAAALIVRDARPGAPTLAAAIYGTTLVLLFAVSASYHTPHWPIHIRVWWRKLDHGTIYLLMGGCYAPVCLTALPEPSASRVLYLALAVSVLGFLKPFLWPTAPRWLNTTLYLFAGWMIAPYAPELQRVLGDSMALLVAGGIAYSVGAVVYARRWPNPLPAIFGYHEVFHIFVMVGAGLHYFMFYDLLT